MAGAVAAVKAIEAAVVAVPTSTPTSTTSTPSCARKNALSPAGVKAAPSAASVVCRFAGVLHVYVPASIAMSLSPLGMLERFHLRVDLEHAGAIGGTIVSPLTERAIHLDPPCFKAQIDLRGLLPEPWSQRYHDRNRFRRDCSPNIERPPWFAVGT